jgi:hypothetical protein
MKKMKKSAFKSVMFKIKGVEVADTITEAGFFGTILAINGHIQLNVVGGNLVRSKYSTSDGGGIVIGAAVFDSFIFKEDIH